MEVDRAVACSFAPGAFEDLGLRVMLLFGFKVKFSSSLGRLKAAIDWRSFIGEHLIASKYVFLAGSC